MTQRKSSTLPILMADDDEDDRLMTKEAWEKCAFPNEIRFVQDGEELMDYLYQRGKYRKRNSAPQPALLLLDLRMPKKDGQEALQEIKSDPRLSHIPVIMLTTSKAQEDVNRSYSAGANSFVAKPNGFDSLVHTMKKLGDYWFSVVHLPTRH